MTEAEWLECTGPDEMLKFLWSKPAERKLRHWAVACCRRLWPLLEDERSRRAVEVADGYAMSRDGYGELAAVTVAARQARLDAAEKRRAASYASPEYPIRAATAAYFLVAAWNDAFTTASAIRAACSLALGFNSNAYDAERAVQTSLLRDILHNPFRPPPAIDPAWLSWKDCTVKRMAESACDERSLPDGLLVVAGLAVLADALEEAGCNDSDILDHLRGPGPHVRGCWVVDLLLGKE